MNKDSSQIVKYLIVNCKEMHVFELIMVNSDYYKIWQHAKSN